MPLVIRCRARDPGGEVEILHEGIYGAVRPVARRLHRGRSWSTTGGPRTVQTLLIPTTYCVSVFPLVSGRITGNEILTGLGV